MKVDKIIKNAKIFTSDKDNILASALVVKDGKFVYVGDESGLSEYEGETEDLNGKFIMPGIIDSHVHVTMGAGYHRQPCPCNHGRRIRIGGHLWDDH